MSERINQETDLRYNARESGLVVVPGTAFAAELEKFEQFPGRYGNNPGNPYKYRPFPKMLYRAEKYKGKVCCMAAPPDSNDFANVNEHQRAEESARRFTERCQLIVKDEREMQAAMENGYRHSPKEAVEYLEGRDRENFRAAAEREYQDRNMSEPAREEAKAAAAEHFDEAGEQLAAVPEKRRRGRPRKDAA